MYGYTERDYLKDFPYTDLAAERRRADINIPGVDFKRERCGFGTWERIKITSAEGAESIGRPCGIYDTLSTDRRDLLCLSDIEDATDEVARELCYLMEYAGVYPDRLLVVGLGNPALTPDAVGPMAANGVNATMHIKSADVSLFSSLECSEIAVTVPGVAATSGLDVSVAVRALCSSVLPDAVIAIDALASRSPKRLGRTLQISSTGIMPGSGLGGCGTAIDEALVGVPVIAIGVPTVISAASIQRELGTSGSRYDRDYFLSPKGINRIVKNGGKIIGGGINQAFGICYF